MTKPKKDHQKSPEGFKHDHQWSSTEIKQPLTDKQKALLDNDPELVELVIGRVIKAVGLAVGPPLSDAELDVVRFRLYGAWLSACRNWKPNKGARFRSYLTSISLKTIGASARILLDRRLGKRTIKARSYLDDPSNMKLKNKPRNYHPRLHWSAKHPEGHVEALAEKHETIERVQACLAKCSKRAQSVIALRYGLHGPALSLEETAKKLRSSRLEVRSIEVQALQQLGVLAERGKLLVA